MTLFHYPTFPADCRFHGTTGAFAAAAWLNEEYLGYVWSRNASLNRKNSTIENVFKFPDGSLKQGRNYLTVLQDHMGCVMGSFLCLFGLLMCRWISLSSYYETWNLNTGENDIKDPRGILGYQLQPAGVATQFTSFKVQGNLGGAKGFPDKTRGRELLSPLFPATQLSKMMV